MKKSKEKNYILFRITEEDSSEGIKKLGTFGINTETIIPSGKDIVVVICDNDKKSVNAICRIEKRDVPENIAKIVATRTLVKNKNVDYKKADYRIMTFETIAEINETALKSIFETIIRWIRFKHSKCIVISYTEENYRKILLDKFHFVEEGKMIYKNYEEVVRTAALFTSFM